MNSQSVKIVGNFVTNTADKVVNFKFDHLEKTGYSYCEHLKRSTYIGSSMIWSGSLMLVHAIWPDVATDRIAVLQKELEKELQDKKDQKN